MNGCMRALSHALIVGMTTHVTTHELPGDLFRLPAGLVRAFGGTRRPSMPIACVVGDRCVYEGHECTVRYVGLTTFCPDDERKFCGIELTGSAVEAAVVDHAPGLHGGRHDGQIDGIRYWTGRPRRCMFVRTARLRRSAAPPPPRPLSEAQRAAGLERALQADASMFASVVGTPAQSDRCDFSNLLSPVTMRAPRRVEAMADRLLGSGSSTATGTEAGNSPTPRHAVVGHRRLGSLASPEVRQAGARACLDTSDRAIRQWEAARDSVVRTSGQDDAFASMCNRWPAILRNEA